MLLKNFRFEENYAIVYGDDWLDLHNDYDLQVLCYNALSNRVELRWNRAIDHSVKATYSQVRLSFCNVLLLKTAFQATLDCMSDAPILEFVGFLHPDDIELMEGCLLQEESDSSYHIIFRFANGLAVKCFSEELICDVAD